MVRWIYSDPETVGISDKCNENVYFMYILYTNKPQCILAKEEGVEKTILFNLCGHGYFDMSAYQDYYDGKLEDHELTDEELRSGLKDLDTPTID